MIPLDEVRRTVDRHGYRRVLFHLPAGLMCEWQSLSGLVPEPLFVAEPCFGACDVPFFLLEKFKADAIFAFGHSKPVSLKLPGNIHFFEVAMDFDASFIPPFKRVGLVYAIQYKKAAGKYAGRLQKAGRQVVMGGRPGFMATYKGQVTGCDIEAARSVLDEVDGFVVCSDGLFHAQAVAVLGKPVFNWQGEPAEPPKYPVALLSTAKTVGILMSSKIGQFDLAGAEKLRKRLEELGKSVVMVAGDMVTDEIENFKVDFWVVTACPRIAQDRPKSAPLASANAYIKGIYK